MAEFQDQYVAKLLDGTEILVTVTVDPATLPEEIVTVRNRTSEWSEWGPHSVARKLDDPEGVRIEGSG